MFTLAVAHAAGEALTLWVYYIALEPYVRRFWPELLITLTRLLDGRVRDPAVGQDLLLGTLVAVVGVSVLSAPHWTSASGPPEHHASASSLVGPYSVAGQMIWRHDAGIIHGLGGAIILLIARLLLRSKLLAGAVCVALDTTATVLAHGISPESFARFIVACLFVWFWIRFGILALIVAVSVGYLLLLPITTDTSAFYFDHGLFVVGTVLVIALYGFYVSLGGKQLLGQTQSSPSL